MFVLYAQPSCVRSTFIFPWCLLFLFPLSLKFVCMVTHYLRRPHNWLHPAFLPSQQLLLWFCLLSDIFGQIWKFYYTSHSMLNYSVYTENHRSICFQLIFKIHSFWGCTSLNLSFLYSLATSWTWDEISKKEVKYQPSQNPKGISILQSMIYSHKKSDWNMN